MRDHPAREKLYDPIGRVAVWFSSLEVRLLGVIEVLERSTRAPSGRLAPQRSSFDRLVDRLKKLTSADIPLDPQMRNVLSSMVPELRNANRRRVGLMHSVVVTTQENEAKLLPVRSLHGKPKLDGVDAEAILKLAEDLQRLGDTVFLQAGELFADGFDPDALVPDEMRPPWRAPSSS